MVLDAATPNTLLKWTLNHNGAAYGLAGTEEQFADRDFNGTTFIENLYMTGHWTSLVQGIPGVVYMGKNTAKIIINRMKQ